jgi:hypothetical protein
MKITEMIKKMFMDREGVLIIWGCVFCLLMTISMILFMNRLYSDMRYEDVRERFEVKSYCQDSNFCSDETRMYYIKDKKSGYEYISLGINNLVRL